MSTTVVRGQETIEAEMFISEEILGFEMSAVDFEEDDQHYLRRDLQSQNRCRPLNQASVRLQSDDPNYCNQLGTYACSCSASTESRCSYCRLTVFPSDSSANSYRCQVSGSLVTFMDHTNKAVTCGCEYSNGQTRHNCFVANQAVPIPSPAMAVATTTASVRSPTRKAVFVTGQGQSQGQGINVNPPVRSPVRSPTGTRAQFVTGPVSVPGLQRIPIPGQN